MWGVQNEEKESNPNATFTEGAFSDLMLTGDLFSCAETHIVQTRKTAETYTT